MCAVGGSAATAKRTRWFTASLVGRNRVTVPLAVEQGRQVVGRRRIVYLDGEPCELTDAYYPVEIARGTGLAGTAKIRGGAASLLAELGHVGVRAREDVAARMPSERERAELALMTDEPVLELIRLTLDADDRPVQVDVMVMPSRGQKLRYEIRIG
ncbi:UTRA domain-containing protein [Streptomyces anulatus]|uniref:UTRA domain-containing protein n=1 Tax=Streptomyces anulatus TaxID=1892 RepID=UPI00363875B0